MLAHLTHRACGAVVATIALSLASLAVAPALASASPGARADEVPPVVTHTVTSIGGYPGAGNPLPAPGSWYVGDSRTSVGTQAGILGSPSDLTHIDGSLGLATRTSDDKANLATTAPAGTTLASLTTLSYDAMRDAASTNANPLAEGSLQLGLSCEGDGTANGFLVFEPTYQDPNTVTPGQWQTWDAAKGGAAIWWSSWYIPKDPTSGLTPKQSLGEGDDPADYYTAFNDFLPLSTFEAACPDATVQQYVINQGSGQPGLASYVDNVRVNDDVWDFAVTGTPTFTVNLPTALVAGGAPVQFTGSATVPADGPQVPNRRFDFVIVPNSTIGPLSPSDVTLEFEQPTDPPNWVPVSLSVVTPEDGSMPYLLGEVGGPNGESPPLEPGATDTGTFRISLGDNVKGGVLSTIAALDSVDPTSGDLVARLASTGGQTAVVGPAHCPAFPGSWATIRLEYLRLLGRCPDSGGLAYWTQYLAGGHSVAAFATALAASPERFSALIDRSYEAVLGRHVDASGAKYWRAYFTNGGRFDDFIATLAGSSEEASKSYPSTQARVQALYHLVLNRAGDTQGVDYWAQQLDNGMSPKALTSQLAHSSEFATDVVGATPTQLVSFGPGIYQEMLQRDPDATGLAYWAIYFHYTGNTYRVEGLFGGSSEFTSAAQTFPDS